MSHSYESFGRKERPDNAWRRTDVHAAESLIDDLVAALPDDADSRSAQEHPSSGWIGLGEIAPRRAGAADSGRTACHCCGSVGIAYFNAQRDGHGRLLASSRAVYVLRDDEVDDRSRTE